jgi:hypothetical protein
MSEFIYYFGAWAFAHAVAIGTLAAVEFIERGPRK